MLIVFEDENEIRVCKLSGFHVMLQTDTIPLKWCVNYFTSSLSSFLGKLSLPGF